MAADTRVPQKDLTGEHSCIMLKTLMDEEEADQGAYTCEAMNARGMVFGIPDGVLELIPQRGTAQQGRRAPGAGREPGLSARDRL